MKIVRFFAGLLLIPVCAIVTRTLVSLIRESQLPGDALFPPAALALLAGFAFWMFLCFTVPHPVRTYILAHELTHALWGSLMGANVSKLKISRDKGSVTLSKSNFLVTLAPYFFPLYTFIVLLAYPILGLFCDARPYALVWLGMIGFTWGFHFTFTIAALMQRQPDIKLYGYVFSYTLIYTFNVLGIAIWLVIVSPATFEQMARSLAAHSVSCFVLMRKGVSGAWLLALRLRQSQ